MLLALTPFYFVVRNLLSYLPMFTRRMSDDRGLLGHLLLKVALQYKGHCHFSIPLSLASQCFQIATYSSEAYPPDLIWKIASTGQLCEQQRAAEVEGSVASARLTRTDRRPSGR